METVEDVEVPQLKKVDRYGFFLDSSDRRPVYDVRLENQRIRKWLVMLDDWETFCTEKPDLVKKRIRKGIPDALRGRVWSLLLLSDNCSKMYSHFYSDLVNNHSSFAENEITCKRGVIDRDLNRTYPLHEDYAVENGVGQESLKHVLLAFADYDKEVKYTQGMNYIVALLLNYMSEEEAFWSLRQLMENSPFLMCNWLNQDLTMVHTCCYQLDKLISKHLPKLYKHFQSLSIRNEVYCTEWFMCVFTRTFPYDIVVRIWDIFLSEGWTIVYQVTLEILSLLQSQLLRSDFEDTIQILKYGTLEENHQSDVWSHLPPADTFIPGALSFSVTREELEVYRREYARSVMKKLQL